MGGARIRRAAALRELDPAAGPVLDAVAADGRPRALVLLGYGTGRDRGLTDLGRGRLGVERAHPVRARARAARLDRPARPGRRRVHHRALAGARRRADRGRPARLPRRRGDPGPLPELGRLAGPARGALLAMADESAPVWARLWSVTIPALLAVEAAGVAAGPVLRDGRGRGGRRRGALPAEPRRRSSTRPRRSRCAACEQPVAAWAAGPVATVAAGRLADQAALRAGRPGAARLAAGPRARPARPARRQRRRPQRPKQTSSTTRRSTVRAPAATLPRPSSCSSEAGDRAALRAVGRGDGATSATFRSPWSSRSSRRRLSAPRTSSRWPISPRATWRSPRPPDRIRARRSRNSGYARRSDPATPRPGDGDR